MQVVTYQSPSGQTIDICRDCEQELTARASWPRDDRGQEYCSVSRGLHDGTCHVCHGDVVVESGGSTTWRD